MQWIAKDPPFYVWADDTWYNERDAQVYKPDLIKLCWTNDVSSFPFTKKTKVFYEK